MLAARIVFTEKGYNEALMSDIAERAGVVEGSIYRFFTNKRDLLVKMVEHWYEEMLARDDEQFAGVQRNLDRDSLCRPPPSCFDTAGTGSKFVSSFRNCVPIPTIARRACSS